MVGFAFARVFIIYSADIIIVSSFVIRVPNIRGLFADVCHFCTMCPACPLCSD